MGESTDPRGPLRRIVYVPADFANAHRVTLECGHVADFNPAFRYRVGDSHRCFQCKAEGREP